MRNSWADKELIWVAPLAALWAAVAVLGPIAIEHWLHFDRDWLAGPALLWFLVLMLMIDRWAPRPTGTEAPIRPR